LELQGLQADKAQLSALLHAQKNTDSAEAKHAGTSALSDIQDELLLMHQQGDDMTKELNRLQLEVWHNTWQHKLILLWIWWLGRQCGTVWQAIST